MNADDYLDLGGGFADAWEALSADQTDITPSALYRSKTAVVPCSLEVFEHGFREACTAKTWAQLTLAGYAKRLARNYQRIPFEGAT